MKNHGVKMKYLKEYAMGEFDYHYDRKPNFKKKGERSFFNECIEWAKWDAIKHAHPSHQPDSLTRKAAKEAYRIFLRENSPATGRMYSENGLCKNTYISTRIKGLYEMRSLDSEGLYICYILLSEEKARELELDEI